MRISLFFFLNMRRNSGKSAWKTWAHSLLWEHPHFYFSERKNNEEMAVVDGVSRCIACYKTILASQHLRHCPGKAIVGNTCLLSDWPRVITTLQPGVGGKWKLPPHLPPDGVFKNYSMMRSNCDRTKFVWFIFFSPPMRWHTSQNVFPSLF